MLVLRLLLGAGDVGGSSSCANGFESEAWVGLWNPSGGDGRRRSGRGDGNADWPPMLHLPSTSAVMGWEVAFMSISLNLVGAARCVLRWVYSQETHEGKPTAKQLAAGVLVALSRKAAAAAAAAAATSAASALHAGGGAGAVVQNSNTQYKAGASHDSVQATATGRTNGVSHNVRGRAAERGRGLGRGRNTDAARGLRGNDRGRTATSVDASRHVQPSAAGAEEHNGSDGPLGFEARVTASRAHSAV